MIGNKQQIFDYLSTLKDDLTYTITVKEGVNRSLDQNNRFHAHVRYLRNYMVSMGSEITLIALKHYILLLAASGKIEGQYYPSEFIIVKGENIIMPLPTSERTVKEMNLAIEALYYMSEVTIGTDRFGLIPISRESFPEKYYS